MTEPAGPNSGLVKRRAGRILASAVVAIVVVSAATAFLYSTPSCLSSEDGLVRLAGMLDHWHAYVPTGFFLDSRLHEGEIPLWNPLILCGTPFAANIASYLFYPFNFLRSCLTFNPTPMKTHIGLVILLALHVLLAGVGTFFFARRHGLGLAASIVAALAFVCSASFVRRAYADMFITTVAWIPVILILLRLTFEQTRLDRKLYYATATGLVFGISILSGSPHMTLLTSLLIALYGACFRVCHLRRGDIRLPRSLAKTLFGDLAAGVLIFVLAAAISWMMLFPAFELSAMSPRGGAENSVRSAWRGFSWARDYLIFYPGANHAAREYGLAGLGATLLALAAFGGRRKRDVLLFCLVFLFFLDCAHGPPLPCARLMLWLAPYKLNDVRRALLFAAFAMAMLAGFGTDAVASRWQARRPSIILSLLFAAAGPYVVWLLIRGTHPHPVFPVPKTVVLLPSVVLAVIMLAGWFPWPRGWTSRKSDAAASVPERRFVYTVVAWALMGLTFAEQYAWGTRYVERLFNTRGFKGDAAALTQSRKMAAENRRVVDPQPNKMTDDLVPALTGYDPSYISRTHKVLTGSSRYNAYVRPRQTVEDNHRGNLFLKRLFWLARQYVDGPLPHKDTLFPAATTVFLRGAPDNLPLTSVSPARLSRSSVSDDTKEVFHADAAKLKMRKSRPLSRTKFTVDLPAVRCPPLHATLLLQYTSDCPATIVPQFHDRSSQSRREGKHLRVGPTTGPARQIDFPLPDMRHFTTTLRIELSSAKGSFAFQKAQILCDLADENRHIKLLKYTANEVELEVADLAGYRVLTYLDSFYPGWHAYVDGKEVPIQLADDAFKAVLVPPGTHRVRFAFRPGRVYAGLGVSGAAFLLCALVLVLARPRVPDPLASPLAAATPPRDRQQDGTSREDHCIDYDRLYTEDLEVFQNHPTNRHRRRFAMNAIQTFPFGKETFVFDYGCGAGFLLQEIRARFGLTDAQLGGCDVSQTAIAEARQRILSEDLYAEESPQLRRPINIALCTEVIEHVDRYGEILQWIWRNLEPGGRLVLTTPSVPLDAPDRFYGHVRHFEINALVRELQSVGFAVDRARLWGFPFFTIQKWITRLFFERVMTNYASGTLTLKKRIVFWIAYHIYIVHDAIPRGPQIFISAHKPGSP